LDHYYRWCAACRELVLAMASQARAGAPFGRHLDSRRTLLLLFPDHHLHPSQRSALTPVLVASPLRQNSHTMLHAWWWAMYWPWTAVFGRMTCHLRRQPPRGESSRTGPVHGWMSGRARPLGGPNSFSGHSAHAAAAPCRILVAWSCRGWPRKPRALVIGNGPGRILIHEVPVRSQARLSSQLPNRLPKMRNGAF
jgi:hypothetical protein